MEWRAEWGHSVRMGCVWHQLCSRNYYLLHFCVDFKSWSFWVPVPITKINTVKNIARYFPLKTLTWGLSRLWFLYWAFLEKAEVWPRINNKVIRVCSAEQGRVKRTTYFHCVFYCLHSEGRTVDQLFFLLLEEHLSLFFLLQKLHTHFF